jgi:hypothetical protein
LLSRTEDESATTYSTQPNGDVEPTQTESPESSKTKKQRWPTVVALTTLCMAVILICFGLTIPSAVKEYAKEGGVFEPQDISIDSFTSLGIRARAKGVFYMDASRVHNKLTRGLGRFGTWWAGQVKSGEAEVNIYLPQYDNALLGTITIPPVTLNIQNKHYNHLDILADLEPGDVDGIRRLAKDFMEKKLDTVQINAIATVAIQSGAFSLGKQRVEQYLEFKGGDVPELPDPDIRELRLAEYGQPGHPEGIKARAVATLANPYPVKLDVPPLAFEVLLPDCADNYLLLGTTKNDVIHIRPKQNITVAAVGLVKQLPSALTEVCPGSKSSPLDSFVGDYLAGRDSTVYIRGGEQDVDTPEWIGKILRDTMIPFSTPGHTFDNLIKNFSMADVHFSLPDTVTGSKPRLSAVVKVLIGLPAEMNLNLDINRIRANGHLYYKGEVLGDLDLSKWSKANATKIGHDLLIQSVVVDAPLNIVNDDLFSEVVQHMIFGKGATFGMQAKVDVDTSTALGDFVLRRIPSKGEIFVPPIQGGNFKLPEPDVLGMEVVDSTETSLTLEARVNVTNPTEYSATIPYSNVSTFVNGTRVGYAWVTNMSVVPGPNILTARASWETGKIGAEWLSQYISGYNTSLTIKSHPGSVPNFPDIKMEMTVPAPSTVQHPIKETTVRSLLSLSITLCLTLPPRLMNRDRSTSSPALQPSS